MSSCQAQAYLLFAISDQNEALRILTHPQHQGAISGDKVTFSVVVEGRSESLSYEWLKDGAPINVSDSSGKVAKSATFIIPSFLAAEHKGSYRCIVSSDYDGSVDLAVSKPAVLRGNGLFIVVVEFKLGNIDRQCMT